jgi:replicative DNA helicase
MNPSPVARRPLSARDRAERRILGAVLLQPPLWRQLQKVVQTTDFTDDLHRRLAEAYWAHQRDEGEPVFNEFLGALGDPDLQELAVEVLDEIESLPDVQATVAEAVSHLSEERQRHEQQKLVAAFRRTSEGPLAEQDEVDLLRQLQENARRPDLRR